MVLNLLGDNALYPFNGFGREGKVELPFPDGGDRAVAWTPYSADGVSGLIHKQHFYLLLYGKHHGIACYLCALAYLYALDACGRDALAAIGGGDDEALVVAVERNAIGVEY